MTSPSKKVEELFHAAVSLTTAERELYLSQHCESDQQRAEVQKLLTFHRRKGGGLTDQRDSLPPTQDLKNSAPGRGDRQQSKGNSNSGTIDHGRFLPGTVLSDRYRIVGLLGKGGMGEVYRADDLELGQSVALKFLPQRLADDPRSLERFRAEVRLARQVSHPNVCRVYDIGQIDGQCFLSMEYVDGEDLAQLLTRIGRFNQERATELARQLCLGLHAAHETGVLHRDLKPANVMIDGRGKLLITDFGLAELAEDVREEDIRSGTPAYMAPEQLAGREVTEKSDIYSLGTILHELYTGKSVWEASSMAELLEKRKSSSPENPSSHIDDLDPLVERVITRCLESDPAMRPESAIRVVASLPGGDPLEAALAAGQTPTPEMVADSGQNGSLSPVVGIGIFICICVLAVSLPFLSDWSKQYEYGELRQNKPEVLEKIARDTVELLGYDPDSTDWTTSLRLDADQRYEFLYRQHRHSLVPDIPPMWTNSTAWQVSIDNPPLLQPGMLSMRLNTSGDLLEFMAVQEEIQPGLGTTESQRTELFALLNLTATDYEPISVPSDNLPPVPPIWMDDVSYWQRLGEADEVLVVGATNGRLTYFNRSPEGRSGTLVAALQSEQTVINHNGVIPLVFFTIAFFIAVRNMSRSRVDYSTAWKLAALSFGADLIIWCLLSRSVTHFFSDVELTANFVFRSFFMATRIWVYYVAFEPIIRRYWPNALVTWTRFASGRYRDPLVNRDVLIAVFIGLGGAFVGAAGSAEDNINNIHYPFWPNNVSLRFAFVGVLASFQNTLLSGVGILTWLVAIRAAVRNDWAAIALFTLVVGLTVNATHPASWLFLVVVGAVYIRMGVFAALIQLFISFSVGQIPMTADVNSWYFGSTIITLGLVLLIAGYGLYFSTLHERLWRLARGSGGR